MSTSSKYYLPAVPQKQLPPGQEKLRETNRYLFIIKNFKTMTTNDMAKKLNLGYSQTLTRIQRLRKAGYNITPKRISYFTNPNWEIIESAAKKIGLTPKK